MLDKSSALVGPGLCVNNLTEETGNLLIDFFLLYMVHTYVEKPGDLVGPELGVNTHTEALGNLVFDFFLFYDRNSR